MRAIIDIGTNSVLLLVARRDQDGRVHVVDDLARIARLGQGVAKTRRLMPEAIERTVEILAEYRKIAEEHHAELCPVATEGLRMADNPEAFLVKAEQVLGTPVRLLDGNEEARLSYLSVAQDHSEGPLRVLDIGGGSTELVVGHGKTIEQQRSHPVGSVRLTERFITQDPPTPSEVQAIAQATRDALADQPVAAHPQLHGLAGTVTTAAALMLGLQHYDREQIDGTRWEHEAVVDLRDRLAQQTRAERMRSPMLPAGRADVIVAGVTILVEALKHCGAQTLVVRDRGLRYALV